MGTTGVKTVVCERAAKGVDSRLPGIAGVVGLIVFCIPPATVGAEHPQLPDHAGQQMLIINALTAVNHANLTGNYTVLRDLSSERFRKRHTAADLAQAFADLRRQKLDLSPILVNPPRLTRQPRIDQDGRLMLVGYCPTRPKAVRFALSFQHVANAWVIDEIGLVVAPVESARSMERPTQPALRTPQRRSPGGNKRPAEPASPRSANRFKPPWRSQ